MNMTKQSEPILISVAEAGRRLSVSRGTIYKLMNSGTLRGVKSGRRTLIPAQDLQIYADALLPYVPLAQNVENQRRTLPADAAPGTSRILKFNAVLARTGLSRGELYVRRAAGSFPQGVTLSRGVLGWDQADVDAWIADPDGYRVKP